MTISNPDKVLYPEAGITKLELARYYGRSVHGFVPQLEQRPLTLVRCPNGWQSKWFYQKHIDDKVARTRAGHGTRERRTRAVSNGKFC